MMELDLTKRYELEESAEEPEEEEDCPVKTKWERMPDSDYQGLIVNKLNDDYRDRVWFNDMMSDLKYSKYR